MDEQAWDDADVERFLARLGERGIRPSLAEGSETEDPKDAVSFDAPADETLIDPAIGRVFLDHRRDIACWLRGLRGEARKAAVADARAEARRRFAPLARMLAEAAPGADIRLSGVPLDQLPDDDDVNGGGETKMEVDQFGGCPTCGKNDGYVNAGSTHVFYCKEHRVSWIYGANIFDSWRDETEAEQRERYKLIEDFERVEPLWPEDAHVVFSGRAMADDESPRTVKQLAEDLKTIAAEVALAGERHDHSTLPRSAVRLRRIADMFMREMEDAGLVADGDIPF